MDRWSIAGIFTGIGCCMAGLFCIVKSVTERNAFLSHFGNAAPCTAALTIDSLQQIGKFLFLVGGAWILILLCIEWGTKNFLKNWTDGKPSDT